MVCPLRFGATYIVPLDVGQSVVPVAVGRTERMVVVELMELESDGVAVADAALLDTGALSCGKVDGVELESVDLWDCVPASAPPTEAAITTTAIRMMVSQKKRGRRPPILLLLVGSLLSRCSVELLVWK